MAACTTPTTKAYSGLAAGSHTFAVQAVDNKGKTSNVGHVHVGRRSHGARGRLDHPARRDADERVVACAGPSSFSESVTGVDTADFTRTGSGLSRARRSAASAAPAPPTPSPRRRAPATARSSLKLADDDSIKDAAGNRLGGTGAGERRLQRTVVHARPHAAVERARRSPPARPGTVGLDERVVQLHRARSPASPVFQCMRDGSAYAACSSPQTYSGLGQGAHTLLRSRRRRGRQRQAPAHRAAGPSTQSRRRRRSSVRSRLIRRRRRPPPSRGPTARPTSRAYECSRENGAFQACSSPLTYAAATTSNGQHQFAVRAIDGAGNVSAITCHQWKIDKGSPQQFTINGSVSGLVPGVAKRVPVVLTNPNDVPIYVTGITTTLSSDPGSSGCGLSNFEVLQSSASSADPVSGARERDDHAQRCA